ncbi:hypothetical protein WG29040_23260 [Pseudomonas sp. PAMC 29040]|uniref:hypothetical protein n=1 Tax=Pseudomonas sp. PAMC 29040 TaxID=2498450 RepID=UPI000FABD276|nr:hypothetical protein [Pseudomonas sp. PAMC 29040]RUT30860.1 hypothetical protein WG29040_23260 [Pseudomonas sp. PAMC 29040]
MPDTENVVEIGELRLARVKNDYKRKIEGCMHKRLEMDDVGGIVTCRDCKQNVSPYWALTALREHWKDHASKVNRTLELAQAERGTVLHLVAAKKVEKAWRHKTMVPTCPHCARGICPEDGLGGAMVERRFEAGLREREKDTSLAQGLKPLPKLAPRKIAKAPPAAPKPRSKVKPRPVWANAPAWADWLTGDVKGRWTWHQIEPFAIPVTHEYQSGAMSAFAGTTLAPVDSAGIKEKRPRTETAPK